MAAKKETEFTACITGDIKVARKVQKDEQDKGHAVRVDKKDDGWHVVVAIAEPVAKPKA
jgi:hypothetical protein